MADFVRYISDYGSFLVLVFFKALALTLFFIKSGLGVTIAVFVWILWTEALEARHRTAAEPELAVNWRKYIPHGSTSFRVFLYISGIVFAFNLLRAPLVIWDERTDSAIRRAVSHQQSVDAANSKQAIDEKDHKIDALQAEINRKYHLKAHIEAFSAGSAQRFVATDKRGHHVKISLPTGALVFLIVTVRNLGQPTIATDYTLTVEASDNRILHGEWFKIPPGWISVSTPDGGIKVGGKDALYEETASPIASGDWKRGVLVFILHDIDPDDIKDGAHLTLSFVDIDNRPYSTTFVTSNEKEGSPLYYPGLPNHEELPRGVR
jgi:hypothetical protein